MMRPLLVVVLAASACSSDPCSGRSGTCITLTVQGSVRGIDQLAVTVDKPMSETQTTQPPASVVLRVQVGLNLPATVDGLVQIEIAALGHGVALAHGSGTATVSHNHGAATVSLGPGGIAADLALPADLALKDGGGSDGGDAAMPGVPSAPLNVMASSGNAQATVTWSAPASMGSSVITAYSITSSPGGITISTDGNTKMATLAGLSNGTPYTFDVVATNSAGSGPAAMSNPVTPTAVPMVPLAPTNVAAVPDIDHGAHVSWLAADNRGSPLSSYTITIAPGGTTLMTGDGMTTNMKVTGLTPGSPYSFTVTATNGVGTSLSSKASSQVTAATLPGAPTLVMASPKGNNGATVTWTAPASDGFSKITSYTVAASPGTATATTPDGNTTAQLTGLTQGVPYTFTVKATNLIGTGPASGPSTALTLPMHDTLVVLTGTNSSNGTIDFYDNYNSLADGSTPSRSVALGFNVGNYEGGLALDAGNGIVYVVGAGHVYGYRNAATLNGAAPTPDIGLALTPDVGLPIALDPVHKKLYVNQPAPNPSSPVHLVRYGYATPSDLSTATAEATLALSTGSTMSTGFATQLFVNPANGDVWVSVDASAGNGNACQLSAAYGLASSSTSCTKILSLKVDGTPTRSYGGVVYTPANGGTLYLTDNVQNQDAIKWLANVDSLASGDPQQTGALFGVATAPYDPGNMALDGNQLIVAVPPNMIEAWNLSSISGSPVKTVSSAHSNVLSLIYVP